MKRVMLLAVFLLVAGCGANPTPTVAPTFTPPPTATPSPTPTPTPTATPLPPPTSTPQPAGPTAAVKKVVQAIETLDVLEASAYFCQDQQDEIASSLESGFEELAALGMEPEELFDAIKIDLADMTYEEVRRDGNTAVVHVTGSLSLAFETETLRSFLRRAIEASGQEVTEQELDFVMNLFESMAEQGAPIDSDVALVKEDGEWVVCDELGFLDSAELFELPLP